MNRNMLVTAIANRTNLPKKKVSEVLSVFVDVVVDAVKGGQKVTMIGFGTFARRLFKAREGRNPQTGAVIKIAQKFVPKFSAGKAFKDAVE